MTEQINEILGDLLTIKQKICLKLCYASTHSPICQDLSKLFMKITEMKIEEEG